jgi:hypothetical protein
MATAITEPAAHDGEKEKLPCNKNKRQIFRTRTKRWLVKKCATKQMHGIQATAQQKRSMERDEKKGNNQRDTTV